MLCDLDSDLSLSLSNPDQFYTNFRKYPELEDWETLHMILSWKLLVSILQSIKQLHFILIQQYLIFLSIGIFNPTTLEGKEDAL